MESYVISVSLGTGYYRHIQIAASATLYKLHKTIIDAFGFDDDHEHAFFMDNHYWSGASAFFSTKIRGDVQLTKSYKLNQLGLKKGDPFKYIFDYGDEWRFQCKVLRELDEKTDIPGVIRSVGDSPKQYSEPEWEAEDWTDTEPESEELPDLLPDDVIQSLYRSLPISMKTVTRIHRYFEAGARLYGVIPVYKLMELYNSQNTPVEQDVFFVLAEIIRHEYNMFSVLGPADFDPKAKPDPLKWEIIDDHLLLDGPEDYLNLLHEQGNKPYRSFLREEFLCYADRDYFPNTPQNAAMRKYLRSRRDLSHPDSIWLGIQTMIEMDFSLEDVLNCAAEEGLTFHKKHDISEFAALFQELNNTTRKQVNRGYTPEELFLLSQQGMESVRQISLGNQFSLFD